MKSEDREELEGRLTWFQQEVKVVDQTFGWIGLVEHFGLWENFGFGELVGLLELLLLYPLICRCHQQTCMMLLKKCHHLKVDL